MIADILLPLQTITPIRKQGTSYAEQQLAVDFQYFTKIYSVPASPLDEISVLRTESFV